MFVAINENLNLASKEDLMLMILHVISADNLKDAAEMKLLTAFVEELKIPDRVMIKVYEKYFEN